MMDERRSKRISVYNVNIYIKSVFDPNIGYREIDFHNDQRKMGPNFNLNSIFCDFFRHFSNLFEKNLLENLHGNDDPRNHKQTRLNTDDLRREKKKTQIRPLEISFNVL